MNGYTILGRRLSVAIKSEWRNDYNIGIESIDREHKQLFTIINKLYELEKEGRNSA